MSATSVPSPNASERPASFRPWRLALVIMAAINLAAFWSLLQRGYSPFNYRTITVNLGGVEFVWIGVSILTTIIAVVLLWRNADAGCRLVRTGLLVTAVSTIVIVKTLVGAQLRCLDAILFSAAWGWAMVFWLRSAEALNPDRTFSMRLGNRSWHIKTVNALAAAVWLAAAGLFFYYMAQQIYYLNNLALGYADCGAGARLMFNTLHNPSELLLRSNPDKSLFNDHIQPGILPFVPLWFLLPDIKLTILLQVLAIIGCALPVYWIGREVFRDETAAILLTAAWLVFPSTSLLIYSGSYGFHWGSLCVPLYFLALACWMKGWRGWSLVFAVWAILIKEEAAIPIGTFGLYLVFFERRRWMGMAIAIAAFAYFMLVTSIVIPAMSHQGYVAQGFFSTLGNNKLDILLSPLAKPRVFWSKFLEPSTFYFAMLLLAPLLFVPLRRPSILFIGSLIFLFDCLHPLFKSICYWYQAALLPVVFWAFVAALRTTDTARRRATLSGAVVAGILLSLFFGNTCWSKNIFLPLLSPGRLRLVQQMGRRINKSGSLFATQRAAAHFITQKYLYTDLPLPLSIDYALLDMRDYISMETPDIPRLRRLRALQRQVEACSNLRLVGVEDGLLLYARYGAPINPHALVERNALPPDVILADANLASGVKIVGYKTGLLPSPEGDIQQALVRVTVFSAVTMPTNNIDLAVLCTLQFHDIGTETDSISNLQPLGQGIWPIERWEPGKFYADDFLVGVPANLTNQPFTIAFSMTALDL